MKNLILYSLLSSALLLPLFLDAQSQLPHEKSSLALLEKYQKKLKTGNSLKTTNTSKRLNGSSWYLGTGNRIDSFVVLEPSPSGYSKLSPVYHYAYIGKEVPGTPFNVKFPYSFSHSDFNKSLYYDIGDTVPDTIIRVMNADGNITSEDYTFYSDWTNDFETDRSIYTYDSQQRLIDLKTSYFLGSPIEFTALSNFYYSPNGDYMISNYDYGTGQFTKDSVVINNGNIVAIYTYEVSLARQHFYTYNSANQLTHMEYWSDTELLEYYDVSPRVGSDFPDWFGQYNIYGSSDTDVVQGHFVFDSSTGYIVSARYEYDDNNGNYFRDFVFVTDSDGDITIITKSDTLGQIENIRYYYYDSTTYLENVNFGFLDVKVYPVPSTTFVNVHTSELIGGYDLYDVSGKIIQNVSLTPSYISKIDLSGFEKGVYFLRVRTNGNEKTITILKE